MKQSDAQLPALQTPVAQLTPFATSVHAVVLVPGWQVWQALVGFAAPDVSIAPPMKQSDAQLPALQTSAEPQLVPFATLLHAVVLAPG
jgi:hypothetical protein